MNSNDMGTSMKTWTGIALLAVAEIWHLKLPADKGSDGASLAVATLDFPFSLLTTEGLPLFAVEIRINRPSNIYTRIYTRLYPRRRRRRPTVFITPVPSTFLLRRRGR